MQEFNYEDYNQRFGGIARLYGAGGLKNLLKSHVLIVGLGGVGTWVAESLARSGVGSISIADLDDVCVTNTNRQIHALDGNFGKMKVHAMKKRILAINPQCQVNAIEDFLTECTKDEILDVRYDYVVDAIDSLKNKCVLATACKERNLPLITIGGAAGKKDPSQIKVSDLGHANNDRLLFSMRKMLRQEHGWEKASGYTRSKKQIMNVHCVYSSEEPVFPSSDGSLCATPENADSLRLDCESGMGSITHVTGIFGFLAASHVINALALK